MQRVLLLLSVLFALYACSSTPPVAQRAAKPAPVTVAPVPATPAPAPVAAPPEPAVTQAIEPQPQLEERDITANENVVPHIALLLPLEDKNFSEAAQAVRAGFMAAASLNPFGLPVQVYSKFDENLNIVAEYRQAIANGAQAVVGPLTRKGVSALAAEQAIPVPTLALNTVDAHPADNLFFFGLPADDEARTVAELAARKNLHNAVVIATTSPLAQRLQFAFEEAWSKLGLNIVREIDFKGDPSVLSGLFTIPNPAASKPPATPDDPPAPDVLVIPDTMVFLATDVENARRIRPYLPGKLPIYATSQIFKGNDDTLTNYDLNGIHFVDMPWLLLPDNPPVVVYPHSATPLSADQERLYALGIDAYRLVQLMLARTLAVSLPLDGVTGQVQLSNHIFQRTAVAGVFSQGRAQATASATTPAIQMFPDQFKNQP
ncbi:MAG: penicillin-binding protein activator [Gallionella sp.]|nr:penicillin-binding protein activator [Gallionella sp.]